MTRSQDEVRRLLKVAADHTGNLPPMPGSFPDYPAPIVRSGIDGRELATARWGMPSPAFALQGKRCDPGLTNVRKTKASQWRRWLGPDRWRNRGSL